MSIFIAIALGIAVVAGAGYTMITNDTLLEDDTSLVATTTVERSVSSENDSFWGSLFNFGEDHATTSVDTSVTTDVSLQLSQDQKALNSSGSIDLNFR